MSSERTKYFVRMSIDRGSGERVEHDQVQQKHDLRQGHRLGKKIRLY
jgi:hypothetical protein